LIYFIVVFEVNVLIESDEDVLIEFNEVKTVVIGDKFR